MFCIIISSNFEKKGNDLMKFGCRKITQLIENLQKSSFDEPKVILLLQNKVS